MSYLRQHRYLAWGTPLDDLPSEESLGFCTRRAHRGFDRLLHAHLARHGVKTGYWYYLRILWSRDGLTQKELSDLTNVAQNTTTAQITCMEADGLVVRERDSTDKRKWLVRLTDKGKQLRSELVPYAHRVNEIAKGEIAENDLAVYRLVSRQLSVNLEKALLEQDTHALLQRMPI